ncbi:glutamate-1-semialdehyde 2,1-aminomutase [Stella humosa]|uniref:Glutamate-1-semialdehyde 2,1-aminomutase n=1 Tax=Stella humosa TaxID=94 RepID=A0A3N1L286_9PROT|nr:aspartate aminotransferase family protein [Stella humosa]ROP84576.1 glutamate-1-semialdehyde 2,1-aminomutase [Stella humosa]BBK34096.1 aspartate aminotransferase family protein [Stella humosa]
MYPDPSSRSAGLFDRACAVMPGGNTRLAVYQAPFPIFIASAAGCRVTDVDGVERLDFINNQSALVHGHCFPPVVAAVTAQVGRGSCFSGPTDTEVELAEALQARVPGLERMRFTNSGTEAVMLAVKAARAFTGRYKIAKCEGAYHGSYDFVEASRGSTPANWGDAKVPARVPYSKGTPPAVGDLTVVMPYNDVAAAAAILEAEAGELAAVIVEPIANRPGMIPATPEFLAYLREFTQRTGIPLIFDEIISFRVGFAGAQAGYGIVPDMTTLGKLIGGGFPVGAVAGRTDIMGVFDQRRGSPAVPHTGTFNANPVSMVAGIETLKAFDEAAVARINRRGDEVRRTIDGIFAKAGIEGQASGAGSLFRIHFTARPLTDYRSAYPTAAGQSAVAALHRALLNQDVMVSANCSGNISTVVGDLEIEQLLGAVTRALAEIRVPA